MSFELEPLAGSKLTAHRPRLIARGASSQPIGDHSVTIDTVIYAH